MYVPTVTIVACPCQYCEVAGTPARRSAICVITGSAISKTTVVPITVVSRMSLFCGRWLCSTAAMLKERTLGLDFRPVSAQL